MLGLQVATYLQLGGCPVSVRLLLSAIPQRGVPESPQVLHVPAGCTAGCAAVSESTSAMSQHGAHEFWNLEWSVTVYEILS